MQDELERYLNSPKVTLPIHEDNLSFDLIAWWKANKMIYPILARMTFELYSIPSMSAEVEGVFSRYCFQMKLCTNVKHQVDIERPSKSTFDRIGQISIVFA